MDGSALSTFSRGSRLSPKRTASQTMAATTLETGHGAPDRTRESLPNGAMGGERRERREPAPDSPRDSPATANRIRSFMGKTPSAIKSKFLSVLGNSTEIINGISNKVSIRFKIWGFVDYWGTYERRKRVRERGCGVIDGTNLSRVGCH
uniref:Uncharacterized protein n=1 Tax=Anopheles maculatus TaxID=74869 RepID=A0A182T4C4_9DIPT